MLLVVSSGGRRIIPTNRDLPFQVSRYGVKPNSSRSSDSVRLRLVT